MLDRLMAHNDQIPLLPESLTRFHSRSAPSITVLDYLKRIVKFTNVECTRELLQDYYVNLVRTHSSGHFTIAGSQSPVATTPSDTSDVEMDSGQSRPSSPTEGVRHRHRPSVHETSTILIDPATIAPDVARRPTVEQNMAFAALREIKGSKADG
ncbi:hypothetical protein H0H81_012784 [Sphagnurus paluster]|uniref:Uncharacterized protein n=1 Tax=Sphagnurus paluster TaxID=117069 RepID=A0A9P7GNM2_9AGAR|nr:hypothetical protein H0H81_012784 [Sphagnurus paluster]